MLNAEATPQRSRSYATRQGRLHCEAFPALDILAAVRHASASRAICQWTNEQGLVIGSARLVALSDNHAEVAFRFFGTPNVEQVDDRVTFDLASRTINPNVSRRFFVCPTCRRPKRTVFMVKSSWACRGCHDLVFVSQRLSTVNKHVMERSSRANEGAVNRQSQHCELALAELPRALRHQSIARWLGVGEQPVVPSAAEMAKFGWAIDDDGGSDTYRPESLAPLLCEAVGTPVLHRPLASVLRTWTEDQVTAVLDGLVGGGGALVSDVVSLLEAALHLDPLKIALGWMKADMCRSDEGFAELNVTTSWTGNAQLWPAVAQTTAATPLHLILDDGALTLKLRAQSFEPADFSKALRLYRKELDKRLAVLNLACERFNEERAERARKYLNRHLSRNRRAAHR